jgi:hypothetical protein
LNPAVAVGAMIMGMLPWGKLWLYFVAALIAELPRHSCSGRSIPKIASVLPASSGQ